MIQVTCPGCGKTLQAPDSFAGKRAKCKSCGTATLIGGDENAVVEDLVQVVEPEEVAAAPASRVDDDEEERRPRRRDRSREDDEDDEGEAPRPARRRRRKRRPSSSGNGAKIAIIAGGITLLLLLLIGGGGFAVWYFGFKKDDGPFGAEKKFLPDSLSVVAIYQIDKIKSSPAYGELAKCSNQKNRFAFAKTTGGKDLDVLRAVVVAEPFAVTILTMRNAPTIKDIVDDGSPVTESKENGKTIYAVGGRAYHIDGKQVVIATPDWLKHILNLPHAMVLPDDMKQALARCDLSKPMVTIVTKSKLKMQSAAFVGTDEVPPEAYSFEADYQLPMQVQFKVFYKDVAAANKSADEARKLKIDKEPGSSLEVKDTTVILSKTVRSSELCGFTGGVGAPDF